MRLELLLTFGTTSLAACAAIAGFFGMNLHSGIEDTEGLLWVVTGCASSAAVAIFGGLVFSVRRFHSSQQQQIARTASLERSLFSLDSAYFALRQQGVLLGVDATGGSGAGAPDPVVTREGLSRALDAVNERMQPGDVDALFRLLDIDGSGVLTKDELGLRGEAAEAVAHYHGGQARVPPPPQGV